MSNQPVIKLHNSKETEFEFNVAIQGHNSENAPQVRFVVENIKGYNVAVDCQSIGKDLWSAKVPAIATLEENHNFRVEVIVDGYYFVPTSGLVEVQKAPQVSVRESYKTGADVSTESPKQLLQYYDLTEAEQDILQTKTKQAGLLLQKAGKIMEAGFDPNSTRPLDTASLSKMIEMVKESVDNIKSKLFS
jgi:hypothetical protein